MRKKRFNFEKLGIIVTLIPFILGVVALVLKSFKSIGYAILDMADFFNALGGALIDNILTLIIMVLVGLIMIGIGRTN